ncbi:MAG: alpha/beta fold hydrolase [Xanthomonadales bacterium]|nr:alpha/beta fold hydrolase [Xanthomonadales bacterium]NIX12988.1 alpha/beta fold hydrolase [Xanthomonadales bacterium]
MPHVNVNGACIHYVDSGAGNKTIVFSHGFLMDHSMFDGQVADLQSRYRCVRFDHRGQGGSEVTPAGYDIDNLAEDAAALIRALDCAPCHFAGLSMGGFVGLRLAIRYPELIDSLTLLNTSADPEPRASVRQYALMAKVAGWLGFRPLVGRISRIMFGESFRKDPASSPPLERWRRFVLSADRTGILRSVSGVLNRPGVTDQLSGIKVPTLVIAGEEDTATPPALARRIHEGIPGSRLVIIPGAGHSSTIEQPERVTEAIDDLLAGLNSPG